MTEGMPDFPGDKHAVTQYDKKAELYAQECAALKELIEKHGWPEGWPQEGQWVELRNGTPMLITHPTLAAGFDPLPCGETVLMLLGWLGNDLKSINFYPHDCLKYQVILHSSKGGKDSLGETLILALCAAVESKMKVEAK